MTRVLWFAFFVVDLVEVQAVHGEQDEEEHGKLPVAVRPSAAWCYEKETCDGFIWKEWSCYPCAMEPCDCSTKCRWKQLIELAEEQDDGELVSKMEFVPCKEGGKGCELRCGGHIDCEQKCQKRPKGMALATEDDPQRCATGMRKATVDPTDAMVHDMEAACARLSQ